MLKDYFNLALEHGRKKQHSEAIECYKKAIALDVDDPDNYACLGTEYECVKEYQLAIEAFEKALELNPEFSLYYWHIGRNNIKLHKFHHAISNIEKAIELKPTDSKYYTSLAVAYHNLHEIVVAVFYYQLSVNLDANNEFSLDKLKQLLPEVSEYFDTITEAKSLLELDMMLSMDQLATIYFCKGCCEYFTGKESDSLESLRLAVNYGSENAKKVIKNILSNITSKLANTPEFQHP